MSKNNDLESVEVPLLTSQPRILFGMTGRQVLVLVYGLAICLALWQSGPLFQSPTGIILLVCVCLIPSTLIAFVKIGSRPLEQWLFVLISWMLMPENLSQAQLIRSFVKVCQIEGSTVALDLGNRTGKQRTYQAVVSVTSRSFDLLSGSEQAISIASFGKLLDGLSYPITIHVRTLPTRPAVLASTLIPLHLADRLRHFHAHYLSFLSRVVQSARPVRTCYYVVIPAEPQPEKGREQAKEQLSSRVQELSRQLARAGLSCRLLSSVELFTFYREAFLPQERFMTTPPDAILQDASRLPETLAPHEMAIAASWIKVEGPKGGVQYLACLALDELPRKIYPGWLHHILALNEPYTDISLHMHPQESDVVASLLRKRAVMIGGALLAAKKQGSEPGEGNTITRYALKDIERVRDQLVLKNTYLYLVTLLFVVRGASRQELSDRVQRVQLALRSMNFQSARLQLQQHLGYFSSLCYGQNILGHYTHLLPTDVAASFYPFSESTTMDKGVFLGITKNRNLVSIDLDDPERQNLNLAVLGAPGSGKSFFFKALLSRLAPRTAISVIDIEDEYRRFVEAIGGLRVELTADSLQINPLEILRSSFVQESKEHAFREKVAMVIGFFALLIGENGSLTQHENGIIHQAIMSAYTSVGITADPVTHNRPAPSVQDVAAILRQAEPAGDLSLRLAPFVHLFPRRSHVPSVQYTVYSLKLLPAALQPAATYLITEKLWSELQAGRQVGIPGGAPRHLVVVDEAWFLSQFPAGAALLHAFARRIRKYNGGLWIGTQQLADLLASEQGKDLLALCETKMLFRQDISNTDMVRDVLHLSESQTNYVRTARRGEALYITGKDTIAIDVLASEQETIMAQTTIQREGDRKL